MKYALLFLMMIPVLTLAHTSDQRYADGYIVDLSTAPVAPWVGEKTGMSFTFRDPFTGVATSSVKTATISIDALMRANKKAPEIVFESQEFIIDRGGFVTDYIFTEEGTYDMHLTFIDTSGKTHTTGFRKQVRDGSVGDAPKVSPFIFFGGIFIVGLLGFVSGRLSKK